MLKLHWVAGAERELSKFPDAVKRQAGFVLGAVQSGETKLRTIKHWRGAFSKTFEICLNDRSGTYRIVYTARISGCIHVLYAFHKKSHDGRSTPTKDVEAIDHRQRLIDQLSGPTHDRDDHPK